MENKKENLTVVIEVKAKNYKNDVEVSAMEADAKLKTVFGGKDQRIEKMISIIGTTCNPTLEAEYNSAEIGSGETETHLEFDLKGRAFNPELKRVVDEFSANADLIIKKDDVGTDKVVQDWLKLKAVKECGDNCASVENYFSTKTNAI